MESQIEEPETETQLLNASWTSLNTGVVNFRDDWMRVRRPRLYWGSTRQALHGLKRAPLSDFGHHAGYFVDRDKFVFVLRADRFSHLDLKEDGLFVVGSFNNWAPLVAGDRDWKLRRTRLDGMDFYALSLKRPEFDWSVPHRFKFVTGGGRWLEVPPDAPNAVVDESGNRNYEIRPHRTGRHRFFFKTPTPLRHSPGAHLVFVDGGYTETVPLQPGVFLKQLHSTLELGAMVEGERTVFRLFAPRASRVSLFLFNDLEDRPQRGFPMRLADGMVWELTIRGDRSGAYYFYKVEGEELDGFSHFDGQFEVLDPYAKACVGPRGPGIVVGPDRFTPPAKPFEPPAWHDLVICEVHLRDVLAHAPIELEEDARLGFRGLTRWLQSEECYLRQLGVNAIELQPVHEFDTVDPKEYGWGYMPVNYFSPASQYAEDPTRASQVEEFRALVAAFHAAGLAVILDVVYNHVGDPNYLQFLDKGYYFLLNEDGYYYNYSGCGNDIDPDTPMARRLMRESLLHFINAYDVDGFRFDLGELLGIDCLRDMERAIKSAKSSAFIVAEPWSFRSHIGHRMKETGVAFWNDGYREFMKDFVRGGRDAEALKYFMQGCRTDLTSFPAQTVNYLCSHDDRVWIDKITERSHYNGVHPTQTDRRRTHLAVATLMSSIGVPMLHGGDDFLYSKGGVNNSYLDGATNALPYERLHYFVGTHAYFRAWIEFRLSPLGGLLRLDGHPEGGYFRFWPAGTGGVMLYNASQRRRPEQLLFAVNPTFSPQTVELGGLDAGAFQQWSDHERGPVGPLRTVHLRWEHEWLTLPPLSCALWVRQR